MKLFRYLMLTVAAVFVATPLLAQPEIVTWKTKVAHVKDDVYRVTFDVNIQSGWHIYDLGPYEGGPTATSFDFEKNANLEFVGAIKPIKAEPRHMDDVWGMEIGYVEGKGSFTQDVKLKGDKATLKGTVEWQSCDDQSCLPPMDYEFAIEIKVAKPVAEATSTPATPNSANSAAATAAVVVADTDTQVDESKDNTESESAGDISTETKDIPIDTEEETVAAQDFDNESRSLWSLILEAITFGFVALITPCVFPMVPVTVSFFMKGSENKTAGRFKAISFGIFIIILYTLPVAIIVLTTLLFGGNAGVATAFNWFAAHWLPNTVFFLVFIVFALSFFGAFEITLPSSVINKSDSKADKKGLVGVFFMALTLVLVSFSCTGPLIGNVLVSAATGSSVWWQPILVMGVFATIFAIPFTLLAFAPSLINKVKSGSWLNAVKVSLGFVEIALAFKFLMMIDQSYLLGIFSRELYVAIWIACGLLWTLYLLGVFKTKHDSDLPHIGPARLMFAIVVLIFTIWLIPGLWGAPLKTLSGYMPPVSAQASKVLTIEDLQNISFTGTGQQTSNETGDKFINPLTGKIPKYSDVENMHAPAGFTAFFDVAEATEYAKHVGKPLFIDITGNTCVNCRAMEQNVWTAPNVSKMLQNDYVMVCVFLDIKYTLPEKDWVVNDKGRTLKSMDKINMAWAVENYQTVAQPLYVIIDPRDGKRLGPTRAYNTDVAAYTSWLEAGLENYKKK